MVTTTDAAETMEMVVTPMEMPMATTMATIGINNVNVFVTLTNAHSLDMRATFGTRVVRTV